MKYKATQVYLDPATHARLKAEAARRGISMAALMREIAAAHVGETAIPYGEKTWDAIVGIGDGEPTDIARFKDQYVAEAMDALYEKKMSGAPKPRSRRARS